MKSIALIISILFHPLLMITYSLSFMLATTYLAMASSMERMLVLGVAFLFTALLPGLLLWVLIRMRVISDYEIDNRRERTLPFLILFACYLLAGVGLVFLWLPFWVSGLIFGAAAAILIAIVINGYWKISAHGIGVGGFVAAIWVTAPYSTIPLAIPFSLALLIAGAVCTSRLILQRHTTGQVLAGFALGFLGAMVGSHLSPLLG